jgi:tetratricopeptide (TPR) repeat protein
VRHPGDDELLAFASGAASAEARRAIDAHLDGCPDCLAVVAVLVHASPRAHAGADLASPQVLADGGPRYVLGRELARGGMGRIVAAHDRLLDRPVALKLLRARDPALAPRFLRERLITARLQHPAIVPIYDAGTLDGGEPFFAMRMVNGQTLDRAATEAATLEDRLRLMPAVIGVVDAVAYAHGEGVIHRDLKPQNVLVGSFGEVVVLDWGIARVDRGVSAVDSDQLPLAPAPRPGSDTEMTRAGEVLGTLAYMAPEQADGDPVDARADVYGLGAILFQVITGEPPRAAIAQEPVADHLARFPALPPELAAIVQRAMAPTPADRYASARELAEDLKRWQAGRMVKAHEYTPRQLVRRWFRKHRTKLAVAAAAGAVAIVFGTVGVWRIVVERSVAEAAQARAEAQRAAAEDLNAFVLGDLRERLDRVGRLDALQGVAGAVLDYEARTPTPDGADGWLQRSAAASLAGEVAYAAAEFRAAETAYERALAAADQAARFAPGTAADAARCEAQIGLGEVHLARGEVDRARATFASCAALSAGSTRPELRELQVTAGLNLGGIALSDGDLAGARRIFDEVLPVAEERVRAAGPADEANHELIFLRIERMHLFLAVGSAPEVATEAAAALRVAEAHHAARPDDVSAHSDLASAREAVGIGAYAAGDPVAAEAAFRAALADSRAIAAREPTHAERQRDVGIVLDRLALLKGEAGDLPAALELQDESVAIAERLVALEPANTTWQRDLALSLLAAGGFLTLSGRVDEARPRLHRAIELFEQLLDRVEEPAQIEQSLGVALGNLGALETHAGDRRAATAALERSIELLTAELARAGTPKARVDLATALSYLAEVEPIGRGRVRAAEARAIMEPLRSTMAGNPDHAELIAKLDALATRLARAR